MKKYLSIMCLAVALTIAAGNATAAPVHIKLAHSVPNPDDRMYQACETFKQYIDEKANGEITVQVYPGSQMGGDREMQEGLILGTIEAAALSNATFTLLDPRFMVLDIPFVFTAQEIAYSWADGAFAAKLYELFREKTGIRILGTGDGGFRHFTNNIRPVKKPDDLKGMKIRVQENPAHMQMIREFGAVPTAFTFSELYSALAQKVSDGQENPISLTESARFYEVQKYLTLDGHFWSPHFIVISDAFYKGLSQKHQELVDAAGQAWVEKERQYNQMQTKRAFEFIKAKGMEITVLSPDELKAFADKSIKPITDYVRKEVGDALVDEFLKSVKDAEDALVKAQIPLSPLL